MVPSTPRSRLTYLLLLCKTVSDQQYLLTVTLYCTKPVVINKATRLKNSVLNNSLLRKVLTLSVKVRSPKQPTVTTSHLWTKEL